MSLRISIKQLKKSYLGGDGKNIPVLKGVNLDISPSKTIAITGESGSGKSTLLNIISGIDNIYSGQVKINQIELSQLNETQLSNYRRKIGIVFQHHFLLRDFNSIDNLVMAAVIRGMSRNSARIKAKELLNFVGLEHRIKHLPSELSGGERQRVSLARAMIAEPSLLLADEPTGNLDEENSAIVSDLLFRLVETKQTTLVLVTHDKKLALLTNQVCNLANGIIKLNDTSQ